MTTDNSEPEEPDHVAELARIIYDQMNIEPRHMNVAIKMAKSYMTQIRRYLVEEGLRSSESEGPVNSAVTE